MSSPNLLFVFADQWRAQDTGYAGNREVHTPVLDRLAAENIDVRLAVAGCPVCCPYRASLMTGQRPLTHGVFLNDIRLEPRGTTLAEAFNAAGYDTAYIGKWHLDGGHRGAYTPPERRLGWRWWRGFNCTHNYNHSHYYADEDPSPRQWPGYDAEAQTAAAVDYLRSRSGEVRPFALVLSWGPPHGPYLTAPAEYRARYEARQLTLRGNVPPPYGDHARTLYAGYYAHITALDTCMGRLLGALEEAGLADNTHVIFTSDHGDMLDSHGQYDKQRPWDESILVPLLIRPAGRGPRLVHDRPFDTLDLPPTVLGLCGIAPPASMEGRDRSAELRREEAPAPNDLEDGVLITCPAPFGNYTRLHDGGREFRGLRTRRYTYVRDLHGPWLLHDNLKDPFQLANLVGDPASRELCRELDGVLQRRLDETRDEFLPGAEYIRRCGYVVDENDTVAYDDELPSPAAVDP